MGLRYLAMAIAMAMAMTLNQFLSIYDDGIFWVVHGLMMEGARWTSNEEESSKVEGISI